MENSLKKMVNIMNKYQKDKNDNSKNQEQLKQSTKNSIIETINNEIEFDENNERVQKFLEKTNITDLNFLYRSLEFMRGNNQAGNLSMEKLAFLDKDIKKLLNSYDIFTETELFQVIIDYQIHKKDHYLLTDEKFIAFFIKSKKLAYLDKFFKDSKNCLSYQGSYVTFKYIKNYLKNVLAEDNKSKDTNLVYKDKEKKLVIVTENLVPIATELLALRNTIPGSRISVCNQGLKRTTMKKENSPITFEQKVFIDAIAFGTTLEKLKDKNYEDAKQLLYLPHQRITK